MNTSERVFDVLTAAALNPIFDREICVVRSACPNCDAGASDPLGMFRPLEVACWTARPGDPVRLRCASGCGPDAIRRALAEPPVDWRAIAAQYAAIAADTLEQLDAVLPLAPALAAAA